MPDPFYLKVMGEPGLFAPSGEALRLTARKHFALLIFLALEARSRHRRDELIELLWPNRDAKGSQSLSMACSELRCLFGAEYVRGKHAVVECQPLPVELDLERLRRGEILGTELEPELNVDGFLRGFEITDVPAFHHWVDRRRAELFPEIKSGLVTLMSQARRSGDTTAMHRLADRLLALDPLVEEGIEARMEALTIQGDRLGALRFYDAWQARLADELAAQPSDRLQTLATRLRRRASPLLSSNGKLPTLPRQTERPFVGRTGEYRRLFEAWEATQAGTYTHVLITGDSGIGKSTLAMRFGAAAALAGAVVARVQCFELEQRIAFGMIGALVTSLLDQPGAVATAPESLAEIARIVPKVRERFTNLPAPRAIEGEAVRLHFAEGVFALLEAIMEEQPLVLIVDDYPRSDEASLSVLHMLLRRSENSRLMLVLAGRTPEPDEPNQATRIRKAVTALPLQRIDVGPLSKSESEELLRNVLGSVKDQPGSPERRAIIKTAAGNPMALELLAQDWIAHPDNPLAILLTAMRSDVSGATLQLAGYDHLVERILPQLGSRHRLALYLAAILGPRLNDLDYFRIAGLRPPHTMAALSELVQLRLLRQTEKGLEFTNEIVRALIYLKTPEPTRVRLHDGIAKRLIAAVRNGQAVPGLEVAWHCMRAKRVQEGTGYLMTAARFSVTHGAPHDAARALSSVVSHLHGEIRAEAELLLAEAHSEMGCWKDALACLEFGDNGKICNDRIVRRAGILTAECRYELGHLDHQEGLTLTQEMLQMARSQTDVNSRLHAARIAIKMADGPTTRDQIRQATEAIAEIPLERLGDEEAVALLLTQALGDYHLRNSTTGPERLRRAWRILERAGMNGSSAVSVRIGLGAFACASGSYEEALEVTALAYSSARRLDNAQYAAMAATNIALCLHRLGRSEELLNWALVARKEGETLRPGARSRSTAERFCFQGHLQAGDRSKAQEALIRLREERKATRIKRDRQAAFHFEAECLWQADQHSSALNVIEESIEETPKAMEVSLIGQRARWNTLLALRRGKPSAAMEVLLEAHERLDLLDVLDQAEVLTCLAILGERGVMLPMPADRRVREVFAKLPPTCVRQLSDLGLGFCV